MKEGEIFVQVVPSNKPVPADDAKKR
jgi:hypothetical protein